MTYDIYSTWLPNAEGARMKNSEYSTKSKTLIREINVAITQGKREVTLSVDLTKEEHIVTKLTGMGYNVRFVTENDLVVTRVEW